jgi:hypothetical protein
MWAKDMYYIASRISLGIAITPGALKVPCGEVKARKRVHFLLSLLESGDPDLKRLGLTILAKGREFVINLPIDLSSVEAPYSGKIDLGKVSKSKGFAKTARSFQRRFAQAKPLSAFILRGQNRYPISAKAGPNGPASVSWGVDAVAIKRSKPHTLTGRIMELGDITCPIREEFRELWTFVASASYIMDYLRGRSSIGRILQFPEKFGKQRVIAILDLFSQSVSLPIHNYLMNMLRSIWADGTFDQNSLVRRVREWTKEGKQLFSLDLTAATDRLPVALQVEVLRLLLESQPWPGWLKGNPNLVARLWRSVLTERYFEDPSGRKVRYAVGQPMGAFSSWPMMAMTHHFIIHWAGVRARLPWSYVSKSYVILGDDIVICDPDLATQYQALMIDLGVSVSLPKSIISLDSAEIAKRLLWKGEDISPISWTLMELANNQLTFAPALFRQLCERDLLKNDDLNSVEIFSMIMGKPVILKILLTCPMWWNSNSPDWERFSDGDYRRFLERVLSKSARYMNPRYEVMRRLDETYPTVEIGDEGDEVFAPWYKPGWFILEQLRLVLSDPIREFDLDELLLFKQQARSLETLDVIRRPVRDPYLHRDASKASFILRGK